MQPGIRSNSGDRTVPHRGVGPRYRRPVHRCALNQSRPLFPRCLPANSIASSGRSTSCPGRPPSDIHAGSRRAPWCGDVLCDRSNLALVETEQSERRARALLFEALYLFCVAFFLREVLPRAQACLACLWQFRPLKSSAVVVQPYSYTATMAGCAVALFFAARWRKKRIFGMR